jgi:competence protein ComEC
MTTNLLIPHQRLVLFLFFFFLFLFGALFLQLSRMPTGTSVTIFHVPGESILIQSQEGHVVLFDSGLDNSIVQKLSDSLPFWKKNIDAVFLTHMDADHIGGVQNILKHYTIDNLFVSGAHHDSDVYRKIIQEFQNQNIPIFFLDSKKDVRFGDLTFDTLFPFKSIVGNRNTKGNKSSLVVRMNKSSSSVLLTGDIEKETERELLSSSKKLHSDFLKIPHHGSKSSSTLGFLSAVEPQKAYISAFQNNPFSHPHQEVLDRLSSLFIPVFVTKYTGDISFSLFFS